MRHRSGLPRVSRLAIYLFLGQFVLVVVAKAPVVSCIQPNRDVYTRKRKLICARVCLFVFAKRTTPLLPTCVPHTISLSRTLPRASLSYIPFSLSFRASLFYPAITFLSGLLIHRHRHRRAMSCFSALYTYISLHMHRTYVRNSSRSSSCEDFLAIEN